MFVVVFVVLFFVVMIDLIVVGWGWSRRRSWSRSSLKGIVGAVVAAVVAVVAEAAQRDIRSSRRVCSSCSSRSSCEGCSSSIGSAEALTISTKRGGSRRSVGREVSVAAGL